jgi:hypothetical protein
MTYEDILSHIPANVVHAKNYSNLFELWKSGQTAFALTDVEKQKFDDWDNLVQSLLSPAELEFYLNPLGNLDMNVLDYRAVSRLNHLTKILVYRQGIKTRNGFNG